MDILHICMSVYLVLIGILQRAVMHLMQLPIESVTSCLYIQCVEYTLTIFPRKLLQLIRRVSLLTRGSHLFLLFHADDRWPDRYSDNIRTSRVL